MTLRLLEHHMDVVMGVPAERSAKQRQGYRGVSGRRARLTPRGQQDAIDQESGSGLRQGEGAARHQHGGAEGEGRDADRLERRRQDHDDACTVRHDPPDRGRGHAKRQAH
ncbi:hypothetical protein G6F31_018742 [Rhizopus arrhizus]|nr:hypothetical protein G6F31_018742 [Rhizopus arrhizus]